MDEMEYNYIKRQVRLLTGVDLNCYKAPQMQRRLKSYLARSGQRSWARFFRVVAADPAELRKLKDYLTINVSAFFRDPHKYKYLANEALPALLRERSYLRVWSAGCARGQEIYSVAMLLAGSEGGLARHRLLATDIDPSALEAARAGGPYPAEDLTGLPANLRLAHFDFDQAGYWIRPELRRAIIFRQHNLLADPIFGRFDLIVCRNVVIYFQPEAKETLYRRFFEALKPGGLLFVGGTEVIPKAAVEGFEMVSSSFYRREDPRPLRRTPSPARTNM